VLAVNSNSCFFARSPQKFDIIKYIERSSNVWRVTLALEEHKTLLGQSFSPGKILSTQGNISKLKSLPSNRRNIPYLLGLDDTLFKQVCRVIICSLEHCDFF
jgi:hypothetical protein